MAGIEEAMGRKQEEYLTYFEDFIFVADKESGQKSPFAEASAEASIDEPRADLPPFLILPCSRASVGNKQET